MSYSREKISAMVEKRYGEQMGQTAFLGLRAALYLLTPDTCAAAITAMIRGKLHSLAIFPSNSEWRMFEKDVRRSVGR